MAWWPPFWLYPYALVTVLVAACLTRSMPVIAGAAVIICDYLAMQFVGDQYCWLANMAIDLTFAELTLVTVSGQLGGCLMLTWALLMVAHIGYTISSDKLVYWYTTSFASWAQVALIFGRSIYDGGSRNRHHLDYWLRRLRLRVPMGLARRHATHSQAAARDRG